MVQDARHQSSFTLDVPISARQALPTVMHCRRQAIEIGTPRQLIIIFSQPRTHMNHRAKNAGTYA